MSSLQERAAAIDWWHGGIDLGEGVVTQGRTYPGISLVPYVHLPDDMTGLSVIDICAWDGYMSFECEERGASKVIAMDSFAWDRGNAELTKHRTGRSGFDLAHSARGSRVAPLFCDVMMLNEVKIGVFDIVLFLGVLYHMRHPLLALERVAALVAKGKGKLILESYVDESVTDKPAMCFIPGSELNNDPTNWWGPNSKCIEAMLHDAGFVHVTTYPGHVGRVVMHAWGRA